MAPLAQPNTNRIVVLDLIRGIAILGILIMNIQSFALHQAAYINPMSHGNIVGVDYWVYLLSHIFADQKFMTIFAMLFGAGIVMMSENNFNNGVDGKKYHSKRMRLLLLLGIAHAYLFWFGDILFAYAIAGIMAYGGTQRNAKSLLIIAFILITISAGIQYLFGMGLAHAPKEAIIETMEIWAPNAEQIAKDIAINTGPWLAQFFHRAGISFEMELSMLIIIPRIVGLMYIGIALFKLDFFKQGFTNRQHTAMAIVSATIGFSIILYGSMTNFQNNWPVESILTSTLYNYWGSIFISFTYLNLFVIWSRSNSLAWLQALLAKVGKMALTNYLMQTFICTFIFYGWGLGLYGSLSRSELILVVLTIWALQMTYSHFCLSKYKFGPFEWLLRQAIYRKQHALTQANQDEVKKAVES